MFSVHPGWPLSKEKEPVSRAWECCGFSIQLLSQAVHVKNRVIQPAICMFTASTFYPLLENHCSS